MKYRKFRFTEEDKIHIIYMYISKISTREIAKEYNCSYSTILNYLKEWKAPLRAKSKKGIKEIPRISLEELKSKKYGNLAVLEEFFEDTKERRVLCQCDCGNKKIIMVSALRRGKSTTCGDNTKHNKSGKMSKRFNGFELVSGSLMNRYAKRAKHANMEFNITAEYIYNLFVNQNETCTLSGIKLIMPFLSSNPRGWRGTASLDRIDSSKGYIEGNVQWVHKDLNTMKWSFTQELFFKYCKLVVDYQSGLVKL